MPGPCSGAPKAVAFRVAVPSLIVDAAVARGAAATTPGAAATRARSTSANGVEPRNGPAAPALTTKASTPMESTVRWASTRKPFARPVRTSVIAKTSPVLKIAMTRRRLRHCMSRKAADSMPARLPTSTHSRAEFAVSSANPRVRHSAMRSMSRSRSTSVWKRTAHMWAVNVRKSRKAKTL